MFEYMHCIVFNKHIYFVFVKFSDLMMSDPAPAKKTASLDVLTYVQGSEVIGQHFSISYTFYNKQYMTENAYVYYTTTWSVLVLPRPVPS